MNPEQLEATRRAALSPHRTQVLDLCDALCAARCSALVRDLRLFETNPAVDARAQHVLARLRAAGVTHGVLRPGEGGRLVPTARLGQSAAFSELLVEHAGVLALDPIGVRWLLRGLDALHPVLVGALLAEEALFPRNDFSLASALYDESLVFSFFSRVAAGVSVGAQRVLELGAGTGGTARRVLHGGARQFVFTDASPLLVDRARKALVDPRVTCSVLDMDSARWDLGERFDVVLALNVLHLSADAPAVLQRVRERLLPGGRLVLGEVCPPVVGAPFPLMDFTFGLLPSYWAHAGDAGPLRSPERWSSRLREAGFGPPAFLPLTRDDGAASLNYGGVFVARLEES